MAPNLEPGINLGLGEIPGPVVTHSISVLPKRKTAHRDALRRKARSLYGDQALCCSLSSKSVLVSVLGRDTMTTATFLRESIVWGLLTVSEVEPVVTVVVAFTVVGTVAAHSHIVLERFCIQIPRQQGERERATGLGWASETPKPTSR